MLRAIPASLLHYRSCVPTLIHMYEPPHERPHVHSHRTPRIPQATGRPTLSCPLLSPYFSLFPLHLLCLLVNLMGFPLKTCSHILPSAVGRIKFWLCCTVFSHGPMRNIGFLGRWGMYACPASAARYPSQTSTIPYHTTLATFSSVRLRSIQFSSVAIRRAHRSMFPHL